MRFTKRTVLCAVLLLLAALCAGCAAGTQDSDTPQDISQWERPAVRDELTRAFYDGIKLNITPPTSEEDLTTTVEVTIPDLAAIYRSNQEDLLQAGDVEALKDLLRRHLTEYSTTHSITEQVYPDGTGWKLSSSAQIDALVGAAVDEFLSAAAGEIGVTVEITEDETARLISAVEQMGDAYEKAD